MGAERPTWSEIAPRRERAPLDPLTWWVASAVPVAVQSGRLDRSLSTLVLVLAGSTVAVALARTGRTGRIAGLATHAVVLAALLDPWPSVVLLATAVAWAVVGGAVDRRGPSATVAGPLIVADILLVVRTGVGFPALFVGAGLVAATVERIRPRQFGVAARALQRVGAVTGRWAAAVVMLPAAAVVSLAWLSRRIVGLDPLAEGPGGWSPRHGSDPHPERMYSALERTRTQATWARRLRKRTGNVVVAGAVIAAVAVVVYRNPPHEPYSPAFDDEPEFADVWAGQQGFSRHMRYDPTAVFSFADFRSEHTNQVDGVRTTWRPPECSCPRLRVWWFGGSTAWGFYQADMETIPSQLARLAWDHGVALDIENRALPGYTLSQEVQKFAHLSSTEAAPDLVIFYDGANDLDFQFERNLDGRGSDESPVSYLDDVLEMFYGGIDRVVGLAPTRAEGSVVPDDGSSAQLDAPDLARHAIARYRRGVDLATRLGASIGTDVLFAWQPVQTEAPDAVYGPFEPATPWRPADLEWFQRLVGTAREELPEQVLDLSDTFDDVDEPLMPDWAHTNRTGARLVASALADHVVRWARDGTL